MDHESLQIILKAAVQAPSGENSQPWRFVFHDGKLFLYNVPEKDLSLYNVRQFGSLVSHGAAIENIVIAASALHYATAVTLFPLEQDPNCTAQMTFTKDEQLPIDDLHNYIFARASNRSAYKPVTLSPEDKTALLNEHIVLIEDKQKRKNVGEALSYGDRLLFENIKIHDFLFEHIYWTREEALQKKGGFYIKELGLNGPQEFVFKLLRKTSMVKFFNSIGFPSVAAKGNGALYAASPILGAITMKGNSSKDFIQAGRSLERLWLTATKLGYDMQLLTAIMFFTQRILVGEAQDFSSEQIEGIQRSYGILKEELGMKEDHILIMFRMGKGVPLQFRSLRSEPVIEYK